jgi:hypothetical protein
LVAALLVLAGCNGLLGARDGTGPPADGPNGTVTPVPVLETTDPDGASGAAIDDGTTATPVPRADRLPPGITSAGIANRSALEQAHRRVLANQSYTITLERASPSGLNFSVRVSSDDRYLITGPEGTGLQYRDSSGIYTREYEIANGSVTDVTDDVIVSHDGTDYYWHLGLETLPEYGREAVTRVERGGETLVRVYTASRGPGGGVA